MRVHIRPIGVRLPLATIVSLKQVLDERGSLVAGQHPDQLPFVVERFFVVSKSQPMQKRGGHAHQLCHQLLVAVAGSVEVFWEDSSGAHNYCLTNIDEGLYIPPLVWAEQIYHSTESTLLVLASHLYDSGDYIDDATESRKLRSDRDFK